ncbi:MAG: hypothetical protein KJ556_21250, partial [Gammaproteobacteria bacterium]|nr:hypothetical protein [Gammaproteobacteria bacterium]
MTDVTAVISQTQVTATVAQSQVTATVERTVLEFSPNQVEGLEAWYDASDTDQLTLDGVKVTQWKDKSGNLRHLTQATDSKKPTYDSANNRVYFYRPDAQCLASADFTINQPLTIYMKVKQFSVNVDVHYVLSGPGMVNRILFYLFSGVVRLNAGASFVGPAIDANPRVITALVNGAASEVLVDAASKTGAAGAYPVRGVMLGGSPASETDYLRGHIYQVLVYSGIHNAAVQAEIIT